MADVYSFGTAALICLGMSETACSGGEVSVYPINSTVTTTVDRVLSFPMSLHE